MKVLYIGGTGEISQACLEQSVAVGHDVSVFNRGRSRERLPAGVTQIIGDLRDDAGYGRLAAGGFRDMTRISAGRPSIWPDICLANRTAIIEGLDHLIASLEQARNLVAKQDRDGIYELLSRARVARVNLPVGFGPAAFTSRRI